MTASTPCARCSRRSSSSEAYRSAASTTATSQDATQNTVRQVVTIKVGISSDKAKEINKLIKEKAPKGTSSQTQGESIRVSAKKRDALQDVIAMLKAEDVGIPLQFQNFRD